MCRASSSLLRESQSYAVATGVFLLFLFIPIDSGSQSGLRERNKKHTPCTQHSRIKTYHFRTCFYFFASFPHHCCTLIILLCDGPTTERRCSPGLRLPRLRGGEGQGLPAVFGALPAPHGVASRSRTKKVDPSVVHGTTLTK